MRLWRFSSQIHTEIFLGARIQSAGNNKDVILDKYSDNLAEIKSNSRLSSLIVASILIVPAFIAITTIDESIGRIGPDNLQKVLFTNAMAIATYYTFNLIFMMLFGLMTVASLLRGHVFKFLHTLPLSRTEIQVLGMMTFVRLLQYQIVIIMLVFPIGLLFVTQSLLLVVVAVLINTGNLIVTSYILIIIIDKLTGVLFSKDNRVGWRSLVRYLFLVFYIISAFSVYYVVGTLGTLISSLYDLNSLPEATLLTMNRGLGLIPFPFTTSYILAQLSVGTLPDQITLITSAVGILLYFLLMRFVMMRGNRIILNIAFKPPMENIEQQGEMVPVEVTTKTPLYSYLRMNIRVVSRDVSSLISLTLAILFPVLPLLQDGGNDNPFLGFLFYSGFIIFFSSNALSSSEGSVGGILSALPVSHRMIFRVKQVLLAAIFLAAFVLFSIFSGFSFLELEGIAIVLVLAIILPNIFLIFKSYLFGKINGEYTLFDIESDTSFFRNIGLIVPVMIVVGAETLLFFNQITLPIPKFAVILGANLLLWAFLEFLNRRMFQ
ncbi:MAG: hypothetical protein ACXAE3_10750 [Candidatus Kariarchaeaceae archaeon]